MANYDLTYEGSRVQGILDTGDELRDAGYIFRGEATPSTVPGTPTERVAYIGGPGTYTNFGSSTVVPSGSIGVFKYTGSAWSNEVIACTVPISTTVKNNDTTVPTGKAVKTAVDAEATARQLGDSTLQGGINTVSAAITAINNAIGNGCVYAGIATPSSTPASGKVFYLAFTAGTYTNFNSLEVPQGINILKNNGSTWLLDSFLGIDDAPTQGSDNLVKSGGVLKSIIQNGPAFDLSAYNAQGGTLATYADLSAALTALNALPADFKKGGMSMKYVQTSDKYVQYRLLADTFTTDIIQWQKEDDISNYLKGYYVYTTGEIYTDETCALVKDYIPVNAGDNIIVVKAANKYIVFYDENKQRIDASSISTSTYRTIVPTGAYYFKVSFVLVEIHDAYIYNYTQEKIIWISKDSTIVEELHERTLLSGNYIPNTYLDTNGLVGNSLCVLPSKRIKVVEGDVVRWDKTKAYGRFVVYRADGTILDTWSATSYSSLTMPANADSFNLGIAKDSGAEITVNNKLVWKQIDAPNVSDIQLEVEKMKVQQQADETDISTLNTGLTELEGRVGTVEQLVVYSQNYINNKMMPINGIPDTNNTSFLMSEYVPCKVGDTIVYGYGYGYLCIFDANGQVLEHWGAQQPSRTIIISDDYPTCAKCRASFLKTEKANASLVINGKTMWIAEEAGVVNDLKEQVDEQKYLSLENSARIDNADTEIANTKTSLNTTNSKVVEEEKKSFGLLNEDENILFYKFNESSIVRNNYRAISPFIDVSSSRKVKVTNKESVVAYYLGYNQQKEYVNYWSISAGGQDSRTLSSTVYYIRVTYIINESCKPVTDNTEVINLNDNSIIWKPMLTWFAKDNSTDILDLHPYKDTYPILANLKYNMNPVTAQPYGDKPLSLMFFSDLHACSTPLDRMMKFAQEYSSVIDDVVAGGDNVDRAQNDFSFWGDDGAGIVLSVMGNHDSIYISGTAPTIGGVAVKVQSVGWSSKEVYDKQIAPFISQLSGVTLVADKCYWYKDYANSKIRLIGLDDYHWKEQITLVDNTHPTTYDDGTPVDTGEQLAWFESVLADAKANNLSVMVVHHSPARWDNPIRCSFTSLDFQNNIASDASNPSAVAYIREPFVAVQNFIDDGGKFIGWLTGHLHQDAVGVIKGFTDQFQMTIDTCRYGTNVAGIGFNQGFGSTAHYVRTKNADLFDIVSVDTYTKTLSLVRIGCNYDRRGRHIGTFVWDYENKQMISCD